MVIPIKLRRAWRIAKRAPTRALHDWLHVFTNEGEIFSFALAVFTSYIGLRTSNLPQVIEEAAHWMDAIQAFIYVVLGWAVLCLIRAPFAITYDEHRLGKWYGGRFIYHRPHLVATIRCKATGQPQFHRFTFGDAEPNAFVYWRMEIEGSPPKHLYSADVVSDFYLGQNKELGHGHRERGRQGLRIKGDKSAELMILMREDAISMTVRIYMIDWSFGNEDDQDGEEGEFRDPIRRAVEGNGRP